MTFRSDDLLYALTQAAKRVEVDASAPTFEQIARRQAITMEEHRLLNVELRHERDSALADRAAALDLAAQYARLAGIEDPSLDDALRYAEHYRDQQERVTREFEQFEGQRFANLGLSWQLDDLVNGKRVFAGDVKALASKVSKALVTINNAQGGSKRTPKILALPTPAGVTA